MVVIKISQESLDAFRKEKSLIPAPIDGKSILTDWIEEVFDNCGDCVRCGNKFAGFVKGSVCCCQYMNNHLFWHIDKDFAKNAKESWDELIRRLKEKDSPDLVVKYDESMKDELLLLQNFYWTEED